MSEDFDPRDHDRIDREEAYLEETMRVATQLLNRGDQRIGQLILNAVRAEYGEGRIEDAANALWEMEAPELLELLEDFNRRTTDDGDTE